MNSFSVSVRLQRLTTEECHVSVPVTQEVMQDQPDADGSFRLDGKKIFEAAIRMGQESGNWALEAQHVEVHPIQKAPDRQ
ncbi:hypothetical protein Rhe02_51830 [Rhizocola hellebori]|uniref:Uncharacterized protein n=2 Tax=Rhizocola hellebori TaxID=1392758 RepID=A0A8J3QCX9_9ACTN|nr:hypothetical protein Rhe02_51830 [Rhizocola hellebori]